MPAREYECEVKNLIWITPSVFRIAFVPSRPFQYAPGQFVSVFLPEVPTDARPVRRIYSFSSSGKSDGYELCVQHVAGGRGSTYLSRLKPGDRFRIAAPFGDFAYETPSNRNACFIGTGTGIGPFKSIVTSEHFRRNPPEGAVLLFGARHESEILFAGLFEKEGVEVCHCLTKASPSWDGYHGRVTDYLAGLPDTWPWHETDFYLCGNGSMIEAVRQHLMSARHVAAGAIRQEAYFSATNNILRFPSMEEQERKRAG